MVAYLINMRGPYRIYKIVGVDDHIDPLIKKLSFVQGELHKEFCERAFPESFSCTFFVTFSIT